MKITTKTTTWCANAHHDRDPNLNTLSESHFPLNLAQHILTMALRVYRAVISPLLTAVFAPMGFGCRYTPTCSQYALEAVRVHGAGRGTMLTARRLCRCHPWGGCGPDPVPPAQTRSKVSNLTTCRHGS